MKILAIRGKNLASLAVPFEVDFESEPLAGSGLFAITGPTGAGKSTLLDALCLALFDKTPRLDMRGGPAIGQEGDDERLVANDVRSLMSRGTAEATAQVDFVGRDGQRWRATWSVSRARGKSTGKVQKQNVELKNLETGEIVGGTKSETLTSIEARLGLTFDQFRKSVLLAQGDFADFLKADANDRSALLQRLTGTQIYEAISIQAHRRAKEEKDRLSELKRRRDGIELLDAAARAALDTAIAEAEAVVRNLAVREKGLEALSLAAGAARKEAEEAARLAEAAGKAERDAVEAEDRRVVAAKRLGEAVAAVEALTAEADRLKPEIDQARDLDVKVETAAGDLASAARKARDADQVLRDARQALTDREAARERAAKTLATVEAWLSGHEGSKELAEKWPVVDAGLLELARIAGERKKAEGEERTASKALETARAVAASASDRLARIGSDLEKAGQDRKAAEAELAGVPATEAWARMDELAGRDALLATLSGLPGRATAADSERRTAEEDAASNRDAAAKAHTEEDEVGTALELLSARIAEAAKARDDAAAALGLADRRSELVAGEPCPLCGSPEHPWAGGGAPEATVVGQLRKRVEELEAERGRQSRNQGRFAATAKERASAAEAAERWAGQKREEGEELARSWRESAGKLGPATASDGTTLPAHPLDPDAERVVQLLVKALDAELALLRDTIVKANRIEKKVSDAREAEERLTADRERGREEAERAVEEVRKSEAHIVSIQGEIGNRKSAADAHLGQLGFLLGRRPELRERATDVPEALRKELEAEASAYRKKADEVASRKTELAEAGTKVVEASAAVGPREEQAVEAARDEAGKRRLLADLQGERAGLLGGRTVADVEGALRARRTECSAAHETARKEATAAAEKGSSARTAAGLAADRAAEAAESARKSAGKVDADRAAAGVAAEEGAVERALAEAAASLGAARDGAETKRRARHDDDQARANRSALEKEIGDREAASGVWLHLDDLLGSADGKKFRTFVQSLTLEALVHETNHHLRELARRYRLERVPGSDMDLQVVDGDLGDERRSVQSLSGGETFLVSLALALGLSSLATQRTRIETLFVDEGFGTLDADTLDRALTALEALQATGRRVGIISHVAGLSERIGTRVVVAPKGAGRSGVSVVAG